MKYIHIYPLPLTSWPHHIIIVCKKEMGSPCGNGTKFKVKIWPWLLTSKQTEVLLGSRLIHVWSIIIVCQKEMELSNKNGGKTNCKKFKVQMTLIFNLLTPNRERSFSGHGHYICEVSLLFAKNKWLSCGNDTKFKDQIWPCPLILWSQNQQRSFSGRGQYICELSLLYAKSKWSCGAETVKKFKVQIWPLTFWSKINNQSSSSGQGQHICEVSSLYVKRKMSYCTETTFS